MVWCQSFGITPGYATATRWTRYIVHRQSVSIKPARLESRPVRDSPVSASAAEESDFTDTRGSNSAPYPGTPRWVRLGAIAAVLVILLVVLIMVLTGSE